MLWSALFVSASLLLLLSHVYCCSNLILLSHVPCFVSASRCRLVLSCALLYLSITLTPCSLMCLALSQHHAAALFSHVPCFVSASCCSCSLMCLALSQHHDTLILMCLALSQYYFLKCLALSGSASRCSLKCSAFPWIFSRLLDRFNRPIAATPTSALLT